MGARVALGAPDEQRRAGFRLVEVDGVRVWWRVTVMVMARAAVIDLGGLWRLRWLRISGAQAAVACAVG